MKELELLNLKLGLTELKNKLDVFHLQGKHDQKTHGKGGVGASLSSHFKNGVAAGSMEVSTLRNTTIVSVTKRSMGIDAAFKDTTSDWLNKNSFSQVGKTQDKISRYHSEVLKASAVVNLNSYKLTVNEGI